MKYSALALLAATVTLFSQNLDSRNVGGSYWDGNVRLERDHKKVTVHKTYLAVEEEVELAASEGWRGAPPEGTRNALEIFGQFALPHNAVITGAILWEGDHILKAKLKSKDDAQSEYNDTVVHDWDWVPSPTDPMLIALSNRNVHNYRTNTKMDLYDFQLFPLKWGDTRRLRIRYLVPLSREDATPTLHITSAFALSSDETPDNFTLELKGAEGVSSVKIKSDGNVISRPLSETPLTLFQSYTNDYSLRIERPEIFTEGLMQKTVVDTGTLAGEFMHLFTRVPDELFANAGLKREIVFLWKWENENSLVRRYSGRKNFTNYGWNMLDQANRITNAAYTIIDERTGIGMVVDREKTVHDTTLSIAYKNTPQADSLFDYLEYVTKNYGQNILEEIVGHEDKYPYENKPYTSDELDSAAEAGAEEFKVAIEKVKTVFSKDDRIVKHIVHLSVGKSYYDKDIIFVDSLEGLEDITITTNGGWPGVAMDSIVIDHRIGASDFHAGFRVPKKKEANFTMYLKSSKRMNGFTFQENGNQDFSHVYFTGHAEESWNDTILWYAQDKNGNDLASFTAVPNVEVSQDNSDLMMLWGGSSSSPYSETIKSGSLGYLMGFVDESYSLLAMPYDSVSKEIQEKLENGGDIENLNDDEKFIPKEDTTTGEQTTAIADKTQIALQGFHGIIQQGNLVRLKVNIGNAKDASLVIYDLKGRIITRFNYEQLAGKTEISWTGSAGMYIARLTMGAYQKNMKFTL